MSLTFYGTEIGSEEIGKPRRRFISDRSLTLVFSRIFRSFFFLCLILFFQCTKNEPDNTKAVAGLVLAEALYNPYAKIVPQPGSIIIPNSNSTYQGPSGRSYTPSCFGNANNTTFYFFHKRVSGNNPKLLVNFMGGGACWSNSNCFGKETTTFLNFLNSLPDLFVRYAFQGIMDQGVASNPLKDYDILFIPYCTGDLHFGSADVATPSGYDDPYATDPAFYHHRGHDNVLSVLKFIQDNYTQVTDVVIAGQSAGGYGAILNYPHIRQALNETARFTNNPKVRLIADASNGAVTSGFFQNVVRDKWGSAQNIPDWTGSIGSTYLDSSPSIQDYLSQITAEYTADRVGQYTALFDSTQRWFFHVMGVVAGGGYTDSASYFGPGDASEVADTAGAGIPSNCNWASTARQAMLNTTGSNFYYYIAPGDIHTKTTDNSMYSLVSNGINFNTWLTQVIDPLGSPQKVNCEGGSGSHPCTDTNFGSTQYNDLLKRATSHDSYSSNKDLYETCFP